MRRRSAHHRHLAAAVDAHLGALVGPDGAHLGVDADSEPTQLALVAVARLLGPECGVVDRIERPLQPRREVAGIEHHCRFHRDEAGVVGHRIGRHDVLLAKRGRVHADLAGRHVEEPLAREHGLGPAGAAVGGGRALVGEHAHHLALVILDAVGAGHAGDRQRRIDRAERAEVGALIAEKPAAHAANRAVGIESDREVDIHLAGMDDREHVLPPILDPLHRAADTKGRERDQDVLRVELDLDPESAADLRLDDADALLLQAEQGGGQRALGMRPLPGGPDGQLPVHRVLGRERAACLHRHAGVALHPEGVAHDVGGTVEGARHISDPLRPAHGDVVGHGLVQHLRARGHRAFHARNGRQRLVVNLGTLHRVLGEVAAFRHDHGDRLAHVAHPVAGQQVLRAGQEPLHGGQHGYGRRRLGPRVGETEGVHHARRRAHRREIDPANAGIAVRAAQECRVQRAGKLYVVDEPAFACEEAGVFEALDALADHRCAHVNAPTGGPPSRPP